MNEMSVYSLSDGPPEESDPAESLIGRRLAARLPVRVPARLQVGDHAVDLIVVDISETGARLRMKAPPRQGIRGLLRWEEIECACEVVWSAGECFGVRFDQSVAMPSALVREAKRARSNPLLVELPTPRPYVEERRAAPRITLELPAEVRQADRWIRVSLKSISREGFEVGWFAGCQERLPISLRGQGLPALHGRVVRKEHLTIGCELNTPLHGAVLEHILAQRAEF